jgi:hypothetical protein
MRKNPMLAVLIIGVITLVVGLTLGYGSVTHAGVPCGSAFGGAPAGSGSSQIDSATRDLENSLRRVGVETVSQECASTRSHRKTLAWVVLVPGVVLIVLGFVGLAWAIARTPREPKSAIGRSW